MLSWLLSFFCPFSGAPAPTEGLGLLREECVAPPLALEERDLEASSGPGWAHPVAGSSLQRCSGTR